MLELSHFSILLLLAGIVQMRPAYFLIETEDSGPQAGLGKFAGPHVGRGKVEEVGDLCGEGRTADLIDMECKKDGGDYELVEDMPAEKTKDPDELIELRNKAHEIKTKDYVNEERVDESKDNAFKSKDNTYDRNNNGAESKEKADESEDKNYDSKDNGDEGMDMGDESKTKEDEGKGKSDKDKNNAVESHDKGDESKENGKESENKGDYGYYEPDESKGKAIS